MKKILSLCCVLLISGFSFGQISISGSVGADGIYTSFTNTGGAFAALNATSQAGAVIAITITADVTSETGSYSLFGGGWSSLMIQPDSPTLRTISGASTFGIFHFEGVTNLTIDGRYSGSGQNLAFTNTSTSGSVFTFMNDASGNAIKYTQITGSNTLTTAGLIFFSTTSAATGNDNDTIDHCSIGPNGSSYPLYLVYSSGTSGKTNSGNVISNCNLFNFRGANPAAVYIDANNSDWTVSGNNIYQTASYSGIAGSTYGIYVNSGNNHSITGNFIGGSSAACGGSAWAISSSTANNKFVGIYLNVGTLTATSVQGNTIKNMSWNSSGTNITVPGTWCAIFLAAGNASIGSIYGNSIGDNSSIGSVLVSNGTTNTYSFGIVDDSPGTVIISNNSIGSVTVTGSALANTHSFYVIYVSNTTATTNVTIDNNFIGSEATTNSINAANAGTGTVKQFVNGIDNVSGGSINITNNIVANVNNNYNIIPASAFGAMIYGIYSSAGINNITSNIIHHLTAQTAAIASGTGLNASLIGIAMNGATTGGQIISQNTIYALSNTYTAQNSITGIYYAGPTTGTNIVARNLVYGLNMTSTSTLSSMNGIFANAGTTTYQNNMIRLGYKPDGSSVTTGYAMYGINDYGGGNNYYFNSVYIGGSGVGISSGATYGFYSAVTTSTRSFRDNIFFNARSNGAGTGGKHYAIRVGGTTVNPAGLTIDYNDYFVSGLGGIFGYYNTADVTSLTAWMTAVGQDVHSLNANPVFMDATAAIPDLHLGTGTPCEGTGVLIPSVSDDFDGQVRASLTPTDIGADADIFLPVGVDAVTASGTAFQVYPNPAIGSLFINFEPLNEVPENIRMLNVYGQLCFEDHQPSQAKCYTIDISRMKSGMYVVEVLLKKQRLSQKVVVR